MLQLGQRLGEFEIVRLLGRGGMGEVYEARQFNPSRAVALKVLAPWLSQNEEALERFWREAGVPAQLDHPGIVRIFATGKTEDGRAYYTMQLVRGISLATLIRKSNETLPSTAALATTPPHHPHAAGVPHSPALAHEPSLGEPPQAVLDAYCHERYRFVAHVGMKAAQALADAHQRGFLHRDIKPSNLMLDHHDHLYLVDFGLTRALDPGAKATQAGVIRGTPWYMSPEQARGEPVDARSDLYSLGVTLYELATEGKGPFNANRENTEAVLTEVRAGRFMPIRTLAPDIPHRLEEIIAHAMHFKAKRRFKSASDMADALAGYLGSAPFGSRRSTAQPTSPRPRALQAFAVIGIVLLGALVTWLIWQGRLGFWTQQDESTRTPGGASAKDPSNEKARVAENTSPQPEQRRIPDVPISLFTTNHLRVWEAAALAGAGGCRPKPDCVQVVSMRGQHRSYFPLAREDGRDDFEFSIELLQTPWTADNSNQFGVFVGWRSSNVIGRPPPPFFCVELDERPFPIDLLPFYPKGRVFVKGVCKHEGDRGLAGFSSYLDLGKVPSDLGLTRAAKSWHALRLRKAGQSLRITVDESPTLTIDLGQLRNDKRYESAGLGGILGIWAEEGTGYFRKAELIPRRSVDSPD